MSNAEIARILSETALLYEIKEETFKARAYEHAAHTISRLSKNVTELYEEKGVEGLTNLKGIGASIANHIVHLISSGHFPEYEALKKEIPVAVNELTSLEGVGPKTVKVLYTKLGITNVADLEEALEKNNIQQLEGFGQKSAEKMKKGIAFFHESSGQFLLGRIEPEANRFKETVQTLEGVDRVEIAGSMRRRKETIGDIDILITSSNPKEVMEAITHLPSVEHVYSTGETKTQLRITGSIDVDVRVVPQESWGAALCYFTGSKEHNVALRRRAQREELTLNEYGLFDQDEECNAGATEKEIYTALGMQFVPPELRENRGEIEAAITNTLPQLVTIEDIKGDMQMHTTWSDGSDSIESRARAALRRGYHYIAITDHTRSLSMTGGLDEKGLRAQMKEIDEVNETLVSEGYSFHIFKGAEVNIMKEGNLDVSDDVLEELDIVGVAIHSHFDLEKEEQTKRLLRAIEHPSVTIVNHPTGRLLLKRAGIEIDMEQIIEKALQCEVALEIDSPPERLDLSDTLIRKCVEAGCMMVINSDAHTNTQLDHIRYGVDQARRGWAPAELILNTRTREELSIKR